MDTYMMEPRTVDMLQDIMDSMEELDDHAEGMSDDDDGYKPNAPTTEVRLFPSIHRTTYLTNTFPGPPTTAR
jgi:hypothetical protein